MSKKIIMLRGLPASGKSSYGKELLEKNPNMYKRINRDDLRAMLDNSHYSKDNEKFVTALRDMIIVEALKAGKHVIDDNTNLSEKNFNHLKQLAEKFNKENDDSVTVEVKFFDVPVEECIKRDLKRFASVGKDVIERMYFEHLAPPVVEMEQDLNLEQAILVDIDGTVAKMHDRSPFEWKKVGNDKPKQTIIDLVVQLNSLYQIIFFSGRDGVCETETREWLNKHLPPSVTYLLYMRSPNDMRKDSIVKEELFNEHIKNKWYVKFILDDRNQVVKKWREMGLTCLQVADGNF